MPYRPLSLCFLFVLALDSLAATRGGPIPVPLPLFPQNNWWNIDVSNAPIVASPNYNALGGTTRQLHPDFGAENLDEPGRVYGIPFVQVDGNQPKLEVDFVEFPEESDGVGQAFYPVPTEAITTNGWIEGGLPGNIDDRDEGDRHLIIVDTTNNDLYELYDVFYNGTNCLGNTTFATGNFTLGGEYVFG